MTATKKQAREIIAKEISKNWYQIKNKKYYLDVYFCPGTKEIQVGERPSTKELLGTPQEIKATWRCMTRQLIWKYGVKEIFELLFLIVEEQADVDEWIREIMQQDFSYLKSKKWVRFAGGSER